MPKLRRPDGRIVSVSEKGVPALLARGYEEVTQTRATYDAQAGKALDFQFAAGRLAPEGTPSLEWSRRDLDAKAVSVGIDNPQKLPNKQAVIDAIEAR